MMVCFEKSCRLCLEDYCELKYPESRDKITELLNKLTILFPTLCSRKENDFPLRICLNCQSYLNSTYTFYQQCVNSYKTLEQYYLVNNPLNNDNTTSTSPEKSNAPFEQIIIKTEKDLEKYEDDDNHFLNEDRNYKEPYRFQNNANHFEPSISIVETNEAVKLGPEVSGESLTFGANFNTDKEIVKQEKRVNVNPCCTVAAPANLNHNGLIRKDESEVSSVLDLTKASNLSNHEKRQENYLISTTVLDESSPNLNTTTTHEKPKRYMCYICTRAFTAPCHLERHLIIHSDERPFKCDVCGKDFNMKYNLIKHKNIHENIRNFPCDECEKTFTVADNLKKHKRVHSGEKPYECDACKASFANASHLRRHERIHSNSMPYVCVICNETFKLKQYLDYHLKKHANDKQYKCTICDKAFLTFSHLDIHRKIHGTPVQCELCHNVYKSPERLKIHKKKYHNITTGTELGEAINDVNSDDSNSCQNQPMDVLEQTNKTIETLVTKQEKSGPSVRFG